MQLNHFLSAKIRLNSQNLNI